MTVITLKKVFPFSNQPRTSHRCLSTAVAEVTIEGIHERTEHLDIFLFSASHSISDVLFTGGREVSDFSILKYY